MWRVRDLAGLGRDDLFSGLRYALSWMNKRTKESIPGLNHVQRAKVPATYQSPKIFSFHFTFSAHFFGRGDGRAHAEEGRASLSSAPTRGLRLRLQAEPGRGGWWSDPRRCTAIFNRTALVGLWTEATTRGRKAWRKWRRWQAEVTTDGERKKWDGDGVEMKWRVDTLHASVLYVLVWHSIFISF